MDTLNFRKAQLACLVATKKQLPTDGVPQIVFSGKSNVGKSSLINLLCGQNKLARVASTPGKTRNILFYDIDDKLYFVDVPGYGYAKVAGFEQQRFNQLTNDYLSSKQPIALYLQLLDCRHKLNLEDQQMVTWLAEKEVPFAIVLTKCDKLKPNELRKQVQALKTQLLSLTGLDINCLQTSTLKRKGIQEIRQMIASHLGYSVLAND